MSFLETAERLGQPSEMPLPKDLLPLAAGEAARGVLNAQMFQANLDWVLPYWAVCQFDPRDDAFTPRMSMVALNQTHRNWTAIGNPNRKIEPIVDPRGLVTPNFGAWSFDTWISLDGKLLAPSRANDATQSVDVPAPIVRTRVNLGDVVLELESFACDIRGIAQIVLHRARVQNVSDRPLHPRIVFSVRPYNPQGAAPIHRVRYDDEGYVTVDGRIGAVFARTPVRAHCSDYAAGDCAFVLNDDSKTPRHEAECDVGFATAFVEFECALAPGETAIEYAVLPIGGAAPKKPNAFAHEMRRFDYKDRRVRIKEVWRNISDEGMTIDVPDARVATAFRMNKSYLILLDDGDIITPGPLTYHHFWFRDAAFLVNALDKMGYTERAREKLMGYPMRQQRDGFFRSQDAEWDSTGEAIWTLMEHFRLTGDEAFLNTVFPAIGKGAYWIQKKRGETKGKGTAHAGLMPPGFSAEHLGPNDYYYWDNYWSIAGLRDAAIAAERLGYRNEMLNFEKYRDAMTGAVNASLAHVAERLGRPLLPAGPYRRMDAGAIGSLAGIYPTRLVDPNAEMVGNTLAGIETLAVHDGAFIQHIIHSGWNPYLTLHLAQVYLARRDPRAWELAQRVLDLATGTITWPEAVHPRTRGGSMGDGHHGWAVADLLLFVRNALVDEAGDALAIAPLVPASWYGWGKRFEVRSAPTHFGRVSYTVESERTELVLSLAADFFAPPRTIEWRLPFSAHEALVDDRLVNVNDEKIHVPAGTAKVRVRRAASS
ncbi:hypothetical protein K8I61_11290, partial [bacterium]|nr:hypothetical protein [bacterium]